MKQLLPLPDTEDEVVSMEVCSTFLVAATAAGAIKLFDLSRRSVLGPSLSSFHSVFDKTTGQYSGLLLYI